MPQTVKIATCCYCGTRATLRLDKARHELACAACGAPLRQMKALPSHEAAPGRYPGPPAAPHRPVRPVERKKACKSRDSGKRGCHSPERRKRRKGLKETIWAGLWNVAEEIFD